jgi:hypothetical protein
MDLPGNAIGITDIQGHRDCPRRFDFGMVRHTEAGELPEAESSNNAYGSAIHEVIHLIEEGATDEAAIQHAFNRYGRWLEPEDLDRLKKDIETYHQRDYLGVRTMAAEQDFRVPLMKWRCPQCQGSGESGDVVVFGDENATENCEMCGGEGEVTIYYRFKVDRLYQRLDDPGAFLHIDYKSSKWPRTQKEVDEDTQLWSYNWAIHEIWPEVERLEQVYDQLLHGPLYTRKSAERRAEIKEWLIKQATAILENDERGADGRLKPRFNMWCAYCEILTDCEVIPRLSDWAQSRIKAEREAVAGLDLGDTLVSADDLSRFTTLLKPAGDGRKALEAYEETVKDVLRTLPTSTRQELGYRLSNRSRDTWDPEALRAAQGLLGEPFFDLVTLAKKRLEEAEVPDDTKDAVMSLAQKKASKPALVQIKK